MYIINISSINVLEIHCIIHHKALCRKIMKRIDGVRYTVQITNLIKEKGYNRSLKFIHRIPPFFY